MLAPPTPSIHVSDEASRAKDAAQDKEDHRMLSALEKPRTHYDVEVVTKLVVYAGKYLPNLFALWFVWLVADSI